MESINRQLNIGVTPMNTNIVPSRYARSANNYQVQLGTEDPSLDFYNDSQAIENMSNANGWNSVDRDLSGETMSDLDQYYNSFGGFLGIGYPACVKSQCKECKSECKDTQGLKWLKGGKGCYQSCRDKKAEEQMGRIDSMSSGGTTDVIKGGKIIGDAPVKAGMGAGAMVGIAIGGVLILGLVGYLIMKKK
tara:strand:+ start:140 stop:712 length:573 start_codon:yes stop_codon:yes gene_type:complete